MVRESQDREDLLRDATALAPRAMLRGDAGLGLREVFAGFRGAALSLYFSGDPVYHFNARGELRRAFAGGRIIRAEKGRLVGLVRRDGDRETALIRREFDAAEQAEFLGNLQSQLAVLAVELTSGRVATAGQAPEGSDLARRLKVWLATHPRPAVAMAAGVGK